MLKLKPATKRTLEKWRIRGRAGRNPNFEEIWAIIADFCEKLEIFPKNFHHFHTLFEREKSFYRQRPQPHPSARADSSRGDKNQRIPPRQYSVKKRMARQQSDELEKTKRELLVTDQPLRRRRHSSARPRLIVGTPDPWSNEAGPEAHPPRARLPKLAFRVSERLCSPQRADI